MIIKHYTQTSDLKCNDEDIDSNIALLIVDRCLFLVPDQIVFEELPQNQT